ncbi:autotransporter domain-containing protein [Mycetohabitans sp. B46]|uniref:autotransporter domain-containing protein n=1 Tax=Mycetohabitans sp. B46 TaxID=2772536 RepID=UPI00307DC66F
MKLKFTPGQCAERTRLFSSNRVLRAIMSCAVVYFAVDSTDVNATEEGKNKLHVSGSSNSGPTAGLSKKAQKKQRKKGQEVRQLDPYVQEALRASEQLNQIALKMQLEQRREGGQQEEASNRVEERSEQHQEIRSFVKEKAEQHQEIRSFVKEKAEQHQEIRSFVKEKAEQHQEIRSFVEEKAEQHQEIRSFVEEEVGQHQEIRGLVQEEAGQLQEIQSLVQEEAGQLQEIRGFVEEEAGQLQEIRGFVEEEAGQHQEIRGLVEEEAGQHQEIRGLVEEEAGQLQEIQSLVEEEAGQHQEIQSLVEEEAGQLQEIQSLVEEEAGQQEEIQSDVEEEPAQQESMAVDSKPREAAALIDGKPSPDDRLRDMIASYSLLEGNVLYSADHMSEDGTIVVGEGFINGRAQSFIARDDEGKTGIMGLLDLNDSLNNATLYSSVLQSAVQTFVQDSMRCSNFDQYGVCVSAGALYSHNAGKVNGANWQGEFNAAYRINDDWIAGLGYQAPSYRFDVSNDTMRNRASLFGLFAEYGTRTRPGVFARVALGYQQGDLSIDRSYLTASGVDRSKGDTTVAQRAVSTQGGYVFTVRNASIMPYLGIDYLRTKLGDYTETSGQFPVRFSARTDGNVYGTVGLSSHLRFTDQTVISAGVKHVQRLSRSNDPVSASVPSFDPFVVGAESTRQWSEISVGGRFATPVKASSLDIGYRRRFASGAAVAQDMGSVFFTMGF